MATTHHEIKIRRVGNDAVPPVPMPTMQLDDTVQYASDDGTVRVIFPTESPFAENQVLSGQTVTVRNTGHFRCRCFIDLKDEHRTIGWRGDPSVSGADHDVPKQK